MTDQEILETYGCSRGELKLALGDLLGDEMRDYYFKNANDGGFKGLPVDWVDSALDWDNTPQGLIHWCEKHHEWLAKLVILKQAHQAQKPAKKWLK